MRGDEGFPVRRQGAVEYACSAVLERVGAVRHHFLTRRGGSSSGAFASLNLSASNGDDAGAVSRNLKAVRQGLGLGREPFVPRQVHGDSIVLVRNGDAGGVPADACITRERGIPLMVLTADCVPVIVCDRATPAIGVVHAGWRGVALDIAGKAMRRMEAEFGTRPGDCVAAIGPAINGAHYEVGSDVAEAFRRGLPFADAVMEPAGQGHWHADLKGAVARQLALAGLPAGSVAVCAYCTHCEAEAFYSARRDGVTSGRQGTLAVLA